MVPGTADDPVDDAGQEGQAAEDTIEVTDPREAKDDKAKVKALRAKAMNLIKLGKGREALKLARKAQRLEPERTSLHHVVGLAHFAMGNHEEALESFANISPKAANQEVLFKDRAKIYRAKKRPDKALVEAKQALELDPEYLAAHLEVARAYDALGAHGKALRTYENILAQKPKHREALYRLGLLLHRMGRNREAIEYFDKVLELRPHSSETLVAKGMAHDELGEYGQAAASLEAGLNIEDEVVYNDKGVALSRMGLNGKAIWHYQKAVDIRPDFAVAWFNMGKAHYRMGQARKALKAFEKAVRYNPAHKSAWNNMGVTLRQVGRHQEALNCYQKASELDETYAWPHHNTGILLEQLRRLDEAREAFEEALLRKPEFKEAKAALRRLDRRR